jgi:hypothetical protein
MLCLEYPRKTESIVYGLSLHLFGMRMLNFTKHPQVCKMKVMVFSQPTPHTGSSLYYCLELYIGHGMQSTNPHAFDKAVVFNMQFTKSDSVCFFLSTTPFDWSK